MDRAYSEDNRVGGQLGVEAKADIAHAAAHEALAAIAQVRRELASSAASVGALAKQVAALAEKVK